MCQYASAKEVLAETRPNDDEVSRDRRPSVWVAALESADGQWKKPEVPVEILMAMGKMGAIPSPPIKSEAPAPAAEPVVTVTPPAATRAEKGGRRHKARKSISKLADLGIMKKPRSSSSGIAPPAKGAAASPPAVKPSPVGRSAAAKRSSEASPAKKRLGILQGFGRKSKSSSGPGHKRSNSDVEEAPAAPPTPEPPLRPTRHRRSVSSDHRIVAKAPGAEEEITDILTEIDDLLDLADL